MTRKGRKITPNLESGDALSPFLEGFDYRLESDDFLLYELGRLIEEDRATFEDEEFRRIIDDGIRQHVEERPEIRAEMAWRLRASYAGMHEAVQSIARRVIGALEDIEMPLRHISLILRTYTSFLFQRLQEAGEESTGREEEARSWIDRWQKGEVIREEMVQRLRSIGRPAAGAVADLLFESIDNPDVDPAASRMAVDAALDVLGGIHASVSARVLAHAISEPMLEEDLELKAYLLVRTMWPLARPYILANLNAHTHEDLPYRWFQLLVEMDDVHSVDLILEELLVHAEQPAFAEDLAALLPLIESSKDPNKEDKILELLNVPETSAAAAGMLQHLLQRFSKNSAKQSESNPWARLEYLRSLNQRYRAAAKLFDEGQKAEALRKVNEILKDEPRYPFAVMLKRLI
jgi:hypothetical protein